MKIVGWLWRAWLEAARRDPEPFLPDLHLHHNQDFNRHLREGIMASPDPVFAQDAVKRHLRSLQGRGVPQWDES